MADILRGVSEAGADIVADGVVGVFSPVLNLWPVVDHLANAIRHAYSDADFNSDTYSPSKPDTDGYGYPYCDANPGPDHPHCAWLQSARKTAGRPRVERSDFEQG